MRRTRLGKGRRIIGIVMAVGLSGGTSGCKDASKATGGAKPAPRAQIHVSKLKVVVRIPRTLGIRTIDEKITRSRILKALSGSPAVTFGGKGTASKSGYRVRAEVAAGYRRTETGAKEFAAIVTLRGAAPSVGDRAIEASVVAPLRRGGAPVLKPPIALCTRHVWRTLDSALASFVYQARLTIAPPGEVVGALADKDTDHVTLAIEICAARRIREAVPALIGLLRHTDRRIADRVIGALVTLGDRRAVKPLTKLAKFRDSGRLAQVIDGIGSLGGRDAKAFLEFLADAHADPNIRDLARGALARMRHGGVSAP